MNQKHAHEWVIIEKGVAEKCDSAEIKRRIEEEIGYNYNYFSKVFKDFVGSSLANYIRDAAYLHAYSIWKIEKPELKQRDSYEGVDYFPFNFKRTFGISINEVETKGNNFKENISKEELEEVFEFLEGSPIIQKYEFNNGNVKIYYNLDELLVFMLSNESYIIPKELVVNSKWDALGIEDKKLLLIIINRYMKESNRQNSISLTFKEIEKEYLIVDAYNMEAPIFFNGYYIFYYYYWYEELRIVFERNINRWINNLVIAIPGKDIPDKYIKVLEVITNCRGWLTIDWIAFQCKMSEKDIVDIFWEMAKNGFLRLL